MGSKGGGWTINNQRLLNLSTPKEPVGFKELILDVSDEDMWLAICCGALGPVEGPCFYPAWAGSRG